MSHTVAHFGHTEHLNNYLSLACYRENTLVLELSQLSQLEIGYSILNMKLSSRTRVSSRLVGNTLPIEF
jgi:hypothetical protein